MNKNLLEFDMAVGREKPVTIFTQENACPFCDTDHLTDIIDRDGTIILLRNKYNVLKGTEQFVLIEGDACQSDMPAYSRAHMHRLIRFGIHHWLRLKNSGDYADVIFFKNFGPLSGGTIRHPHMQYIAFPALTEPLTVQPEEFSGPVIYEQGQVKMTVSEQPHIGFWEFNLIATAQDSATIDTLADYIQLGTDYLTHHFHKHCNSYNIFFYEREGTIYVKLTPRFATPPIYIGYNLRVRPSNYQDAIAELHHIYGTSPFA